MILSTIFSFLGGSVFRMLWGEISSFINKKQDHEYELDRMKLDSLIADKAHTRNIESLRLQTELGIKEIQVKGDVAISETEANAWLDTVRSTSKLIGNKFIDAWNGIIRPLVATWTILMISIDFAQRGWVLDENGWMLASAALGIYLADRTLFKRGK